MGPAKARPGLPQGGDAGLGVVTNALTKVLGAQVLKDMQTFVSALDTMFGGFRERAHATYELLQAGVRRSVVAAPEPDALREAAYFVERLEEERMPLAGLVVNRATGSTRTGISGDQASAAAETLDGARRRDAAAARRPHPDRGARDPPASAVRRVAPGVPTTVVPALSTDVHDLDGLRLVGELLAG